jgi:hypothetical protein
MGWKDVHEREKKREQESRLGRTTTEDNKALTCVLEIK